MAQSPCNISIGCAGGACGTGANGFLGAKKVKPVAAPESEKAKPEAIVDDDNLPALRYSAHVYASSAEKRSIVLNGQSWKEGESPLPNLVIEQIQQDVTLFSFNGKTFTLTALDDWPGGIIEDSPQGE